VAFATTQDVAARLGRELTEAEDEQAEYLLDAATSVVAEALGRDDAWADALDPVPTIVLVYTVELVVRAMGNPQGAASVQETLGQYSHSVRYDPGTAGMVLTDLETLRLRRGVNGQLSGSARLDSMIRDNEEVVP
jgi:hypothetical protein